MPSGTASAGQVGPLYPFPEVSQKESDCQEVRTCGVNNAGALLCCRLVCPGVLELTLRFRNSTSMFASL